MPVNADRPRWVRVLRGTYLVLVATLLLLVLVEVGWRIVHGAVLAWGKERPEFVGIAPDSVPYTLHPYFQVLSPPTKQHASGSFLAGWQVIPPEAIEEKGRFRILFLGGSTTGSRYPEFVREELEKSIGPVTVYNLGYAWQCSLHSLYKVWTYADGIQPDLVIDLEVVNDFYRGFTPPGYSLPVYRSDYSHFSGGLHMFWSPGRSRYGGRDAFFARPVGEYESYETHDESLSGLLRSIVRNSAVLHAMDVSLDGPVAPSGGTALAPDETCLRSLPDFERNMRNIAASCRAKGIPVLFLTMPSTTERDHWFLKPKGLFTNDGVRVLSDADFARGMERFNEVVLALRDEPAAHVLDVAGAIRDPALFHDEVHLTHEGQRAEAQLVAKYVLERELLREPRNR